MHDPSPREINAYRIRHFLEDYRRTTGELWQGDVPEMADELGISERQVNVALKYARTRAIKGRGREPGWTIPPLKKGNGKRHDRFWQVVILDGTGNGNLSEFFHSGRRKLTEATTHLGIAYNALHSLQVQAGIMWPGIHDLAEEFAQASQFSLRAIKLMMLDAEDMQNKLDKAREEAMARGEVL